MPGMIAALSMLQTLLLTALSVAREREQGTFDQLLVTPLRPGEIMVGKALPSIFIGLLQSTLVLLVAIFWFQIPFAGSLLVLYTGLVLFVTASVGIGLAISALSANMQQAMLFTFVLVMPLMLLSGPHHLDQEHAAADAVRDARQPAALRDRPGAARLPRGSRHVVGGRRPLAARPHGRGHAADRRVAVPQPSRLNKESS